MTTKVEAVFEARIKVEVDADQENEAITSADVMQAVVNALGYTGIAIEDVIEWTQL